MIRRILVSLFFLSELSAVCRAGDSIGVKIKHLGLEGVYSNSGTPTWIAVEVRNAGDRPASFDLVVSELNLEDEARPASETCEAPLTLAPGEVRSMDVPLHVVPLNTAVVYVQARGSDGHSLGRTARRVGQKTESQVVALLCASPELCRSLQQSILSSGTAEEQTKKSQSLRILQLSEPPPVDWAYSPASTVILAAPLAKLSEAQKEALELFLARGGTLALIEDQLGEGASPKVVSSGGPSSRGSLPAGDKPRFLESYRVRAAEGKAYPVAAGQLVRFRSISTPNFTDYFRPLGFSENTPQEIREKWRHWAGPALNGNPSSETPWLQKRLGTTFHFPSFLDLLLWIAAYLVFVGVVNFVALRRIGRPELGWITIPGISLLFSALLYVISAWNHPRNFGLDEFVVYYADPLSPLASSRAKIRVSAPVRSLVQPVLPREFVYECTQREFADFEGFTPARGGEFLTQIRLGERWSSEMALRRWSFRDLDFAGRRRFAGPIYRDPVGRLHNDSGVSYQQAIVVDHEDVFLLDRFPSGATVDLGHVRRLPYAQETGRSLPDGQSYPGPPFAFHTTEGDWHTSEQQLRSYRAEWEALPTQPFSLLELIRGWSPKGDDVFCKTKAVFFGFSTEATLGAALRDRSPDHKAYSLTIVTFKEWP